MKSLKIELTESEYASLNECLAVLRKRIDQEYQFSREESKIEPINDPIFRAASELQFKLAKTHDPESTVTLDDYLDFGKDS